MKDYIEDMESLSFWHIHTHIYILVELVFSVQVQITFSVSLWLDSLWRETEDILLIDCQDNYIQVASLVNETTPLNAIQYMLSTACTVKQ